MIVLDTSALLSIQSRGRDADRLLDAQVEPCDEEQAEIGLSALERFGKGRHPAVLNLGDLFAYALAAHRGMPLLYVGADFAQTDVRSA